MREGGIRLGRRQYDERLQPAGPPSASHYCCRIDHLGTGAQRRLYLRWLDPLAVNLHLAVLAPICLAQPVGLNAHEIAGSRDAHIRIVWILLDVS